MDINKNINVVFNILSDRFKQNIFFLNFYHKPLY